MKRRFGEWWRRGFEWFKPTFSDAGTAGLGAAAIFLVRAFPSSNSDEWDLLMMLPVAFLGLGGLVLRRFGQP